MNFEYIDDEMKDHPEVGVLHNLADRLVLAEARAKLDRATTTEALAAWAREWGRPALICLETLRECAEDQDAELDYNDRRAA